MMKSIVRNGPMAVAVMWLATGLYPDASGVQVVRAQARPQAGAADEGVLDVVQLRPNFYVIAGAGGNVAVQTGQDGAVVVDSGSADRADAVAATI